MTYSWSWSYRSAMGSLGGRVTGCDPREAVSRVRPWAVDVSSGVEDAPGIKSPARLRAFFASLTAAPLEDQ